MKAHATIESVEESSRLFLALLIWLPVGAAIWAIGIYGIVKITGWW